MSRDLIAFITLVACSCGAAWFFVGNGPDNPMSATVASTEVHLVAPGDYRRIACASSIAAQVVPRLVEADRVLLVPSWYADGSPEAWRLAHAGTVSAGDDLEVILAAGPDLVIFNSVEERPEKIARLRAAGLPVLDLGPIRGWASLRADILAIGAALQVPERAAALAHALGRRLNQVAAHIPDNQRLGAIWLANYGGKLYGGTTGSSYNDLLRFAGLEDIAAGQFADPWPPYPSERVLAMDPPVIVTDPGGAEALKRIPGFDRLQAVQNNRIIEMPKGTDTTGPRLLEAAEFLCDAVYGNRGGTTEGSE